MIRYHRRPATNHPSVKVQTPILHRNAIAYYAINKKRKKKNKGGKKKGDTYMYTRNSQSAVTSDEDRGDKSTLPREVSSEKKKRKKEKKKSARACRCCFRSLPLFKHRTRYTCSSFPLPLLVPRESGQLWFFDSKKKKKKERKKLVGYRK